ncbi:MAG: hypothetical protein CME62_04725 [Halobacteriovoraceae bacterium]|nr:hypothetical protein [Halobacteriovoraceae bacterium]|tara:strand:- start:13471 stop:13668 length:198 start_codon:yes stop_codon:yes gene_type:complete
MARRKKEKTTYKYECNLTGEEYILTAKADNPEELMSVKAWYEMNPDKDDRPDDVKKKLGLEISES